MNGDDMMTATRFGRLWSVLESGREIADVDARLRGLRHDLYSLPTSDLIDLRRLVSLVLARSVGAICDPADTQAIRVIAGVVAGVVVGQANSLDTSEICDAIDACLNPSVDDPDPFVPAQIIFAIGLPDSAKSEVSRALVGPPTIVDIIDATAREVEAAGWRRGSDFHLATASTAPGLNLSRVDSRDGPAVEIVVAMPAASFVIATESSPSRAAAIATSHLDRLAGR